MLHGMILDTPARSRQYCTTRWWRACVAELELGLMDLRWALWTLSHSSTHGFPIYIYIFTLRRTNIRGEMPTALSQRFIASSPQLATEVSENTNITHVEGSIYFVPVDTRLDARMD
jgi:hypothetical protein